MGPFPPPSVLPRVMPRPGMPQRVLGATLAAHRAPIIAKGAHSQACSRASEPGPSRATNAAPRAPLHPTRLTLPVPLVRTEGWATSATWRPRQLPANPPPTPTTRALTPSPTFSTRSRVLAYPTACGPFQRARRHWQPLGLRHCSGCRLLPPPPRRPLKALQRPPHRPPLERPLPLQAVRRAGARP